MSLGTIYEKGRESKQLIILQKIFSDLVGVFFKSGTSPLIVPSLEAASLHPLRAIFHVFMNVLKTGPFEKGVTTSASLSVPD